MIDLKPFDSSNSKLLDALYEVRNAYPEDTLLRMARPKGQSRDQIKELISNLEKSDNFYYFIEEFDCSNESIIYGTIQATWNDRISRTVDIGISIFPESQGKGIGKQSVKLLIVKLKNQFNVRKCYVHVLSCNIKSLSLFKKIGFKECGLLSGHFYMNGSHEDVLIFEMFL